MAHIIKSLDITQKLEVLSQDSQYDLACACAPGPEEHRKRSAQQKWVYPVTFASGRKTFLFKTLLSNVCRNNCRYCPLRKAQDKAQRLSLAPYEIAGTFLDYLRRRKVSGLFLSSGVSHVPDEVMRRINNAAAIIRRSGFRGYIHLKIIPGASQAAIKHSLSLASAVSLNIEVPGKEHFQALALEKDYNRDIMESISYISRLRMERDPARRPHQTTQFIVGAGAESDRQIVLQTGQLYQNYKLNRVYFSAYQRGAGESNIPGEQSTLTNAQMLTREHRLYQADWLLRKYGFCAGEIPFEQDGNLSLEYDPKEAWAKRNPHCFPVNINQADKLSLLRVPGVGEVTVNQILRLRQAGRKLRNMEELGRLGKRLKKAAPYLSFS